MVRGMPGWVNYLLGDAHCGCLCRPSVWLGFSWLSVAVGNVSAMELSFGMNMWIKCLIQKSQDVDIWESEGNTFSHFGKSQLVYSGTSKQI